MLTFLGIGAQKAGTTWLYEHLASHPAIGFPGGKELHFWDAPGGRDLAWYHDRFRAPDRLEGEITPSYAFLPSGTVAKIRESFPELRLLYLLRNPIDRAWSGARMALKRAELLPDEVSLDWYRAHFYSRGSMARGDYGRTIRTWLAEFPRDALLCLLFDDLVANPRDVLRRCAAHIGADPTHFDRVPEAILRQRIHAGTDMKLPAALHAELREFYRKRITGLSNDLGLNAEIWLD